MNSVLGPKPHRPRRGTISVMFGDLRWWIREHLAVVAVVAVVAGLGSVAVFMWNTHTDTSDGRDGVPRTAPTSVLSEPTEGTYEPTGVDVDVVVAGVGEAELTALAADPATSIRCRQVVATLQNNASAQADSAAVAELEEQFELHCNTFENPDEP